MAPRTRATADLTQTTEAVLSQLSAKHFRNARGDAIRTAISLLAWLISEREAGRSVVSVEREAVPAKAQIPVLPGLEESLADEWQWLVPRPHRWRRQLWLKGRSMTAGDFARTVEIEGWDPNTAAVEFDLPVEAVIEAQRYLAANRALVDAEERENRIAADRGAAAKL